LHRGLGRGLDDFDEEYLALSDATCLEVRGSNGWYGCPVSIA
jgi:hypothetical protein